MKSDILSLQWEANQEMHIKETGKCFRGSVMEGESWKGKEIIILGFS